MKSALKEGFLSFSSAILAVSSSFCASSASKRSLVVRVNKPSFNADFIRFWLMKFRKFDVSQQKQRKALIEIFVNAIFLYDDRMLITFNYKDGSQTVRFEDTLAADELAGNSSDLSSSARPQEKPR